MGQISGAERAFAGGLPPPKTSIHGGRARRCNALRAPRSDAPRDRPRQAPGIRWCPNRTPPGIRRSRGANDPQERSAARVAELRLAELALGSTRNGAARKRALCVAATRRSRSAGGRF
jgi:hypothetical protein